jgi:hypothetical protein
LSINFSLTLFQVIHGAPTEGGAFTFFKAGETTAEIERESFEIGGEDVGGGGEIERCGSRVRAQLAANIFCGVECGDLTNDRVYDPHIRQEDVDGLYAPKISLSHPPPPPPPSLSLSRTCSLSDD